MLEQVVIEKLVHGGQGLGVLADGRKVFVWNALPGETVEVRLTKKRRDYAEGVAEKITNPSADRIDPKEAIYLATSPWQIMNFAAENTAKQSIVKETFAREEVRLPDFEVISDGVDFNYRNKIEFSFYGDDEGLHYAFYNRGSHQKQIVSGSALALPAINEAADGLLTLLNEHKLRAGDLKSVIFRCTQDGRVVAALFVRPTTVADLPLPSGLQGLKVFHSNPKSPASVATKLLREVGDCQLTDELLGMQLNYEVVGFFQVNVPVFERALRTIEQSVKETSASRVVDLYSGVGTIGIAVGADTLIELDPANVLQAKQNVGNARVEVIQASTEQALEAITSASCIIVDPPRSGLHPKVIECIKSAKPERLIYLSCNPATQARDVALLREDFVLQSFETYNFFPRTPHIESLAILGRR